MVKQYTVGSDVLELLAVEGRLRRINKGEEVLCPACRSKMVSLKSAFGNFDTLHCTNPECEYS